MSWRRPSNSQAGADASISDVVLPADGTYHIHVQAPADHPGSTGNYVLSAYGSPVHDSPLTLNQQVNSQLDTPVSMDRWEFSAVANQQVQFHLVAASSPDIQFDLSGPGGFTGFTGLTADSPVRDSADFRELYLDGARGRVADRCVRVRDGNQPDRSRRWERPSRSRWPGAARPSSSRSRSRPPARLQVRLNDAQTCDQNEVYVKFGAPPTRADYDYRFSAPASANQVVTVPQATAGTWYILVYNALGAGSRAATPLTAAASGLFLGQVSPAELGTTAR